MRLTYLSLILALFMAGCSDPSSRGKGTAVQDSIPDSTTAQNQEAMQLIDDTMYVANMPSLSLYASGRALNSEFKYNLPYGTKVVLRYAENDKGEFNISQGLAGHYFRVYTANDSGFVFQRGLSSLPVPEINGIGNDKFARLRSFEEKLTAAGIEHAYAEPTENADGGKSTWIDIPATCIEEAFLLAKICFWISESYDYPRGGSKVLSTPAAPSKYAKTLPYTESRHEYIVLMEQEGQPSEIEYKEDNEVGGRSVRLEPSKLGWKISENSWTH